LTAQKKQLMVKQSVDGGLTRLHAQAIAESTNEVDYPFLLSNANIFPSSGIAKSEGYRLIPVK
jgi:hypothetical protein